MGKREEHERHLRTVVQVLKKKKKLYAKFSKCEFWKANVVAGPLSRKAESMGSLSFISTVERPLAMDFQVLSNRLYDDPHLLVLKGMMQHGDAKEVTNGDDRVWRLHGQYLVPAIDGSRELILEETHSSMYSIHPGAMKIYCDLKQHYWCRRMKKDIVGHIFRYLNCQQVKYEYYKLGGLLHKIDIPE
ncbi:uncharacterized protein [Nicotiana sylvestris]|uniref:uncharacterized protein n=1 Tax=Nicotiana sylvestris TaxID=4096 RepID=UPI00388CC8E1